MFYLFLFLGFGYMDPHTKHTLLLGASLRHARDACPVVLSLILSS